MRSSLYFAIILSVAMGASAACGRGGNESAERREYPLQGQVLTVAADHKEASIKHEEIKGFMPAMTMPYKVLDSKEFESLVPGDLINATLVIVSNDAYLQGVKKVGQAPLEKPVAESAAPSASSGFELLKEGEQIPATSFVDQDGQARTFEGFKGSFVVVTFIYTKCPMPTFCPLMDRHFVAIQEKLEAERRPDVRLVSVSFDPIVDTPPVLKQHAQMLGADLKRWTFLTGDRDEVDRFASRFGVSVSRALNDPRDITHNLRTVIVDRDGNLAKTYTGNGWTPDQLLTDLKALGG
jgi:protein SCO1/2